MQDRNRDFDGNGSVRQTFEGKESSRGKVNIFQTFYENARNFVNYCARAKGQILANSIYEQGM